MRKESKEMAVTAATMKKEKRNEPAATTFVNYLESWYQNKCLSNSTRQQYGCLLLLDDLQCH